MFDRLIKNAKGVNFLASALLCSLPSFATEYTSKALTADELIVTSQFNESPTHEGTQQLVDGNLDSKFLTFRKSNRIRIKTHKPTLLSHYNITSANDAPGRDPKLWTVEGSVDGQTWIKLDEQKQQHFTQRKMTHSYPIRQLQKFQYYRFNFTHAHRSMYGDDYLQIAEVSLFAKTKAPISGFSASKAVVKIQESVRFTDESNNYPAKRTWFFEQGTPQTSTEQFPEVTYKAPGSYKVTLVTSNEYGEDEITRAHAIKVLDPKKPWQGFTYPKVEMAHQDLESAGYQRINRLMPDIEQTINDISLKVNQKLYRNFTQVPEFDKVVFSLQWSDVLASRGGSGKTMLLTFSTKYIEEKLAQQPDDKVLYELKGVFWHELTHGYQYHPSNGEYKQGTPYHAFIEGVADLIRIDAGYHKTRMPKSSKSWLGGYTNTGFFLHWIAQNYDKNFAYKFNQSAAEGAVWSFDGAIEEIIGKSTNVLWLEYQDSLRVTENKKAVNSED